MDKFFKKTMKSNHFSIKSHIVIAIAILIAPVFNVQGQPVPSPENNIPFLVTFGKKAPTFWGDFDFSQIWFFVVPDTYKGMVYIRVFDPDTGGANDEINGVFDTKMLYSIYGGKDAYSHEEAQKVNPKGKYKTGNLLASKVFGNDPKYDNQWYTFGPFNPTEGEHFPAYKAYYFKVICEGIEGDDGNMYRYFMSTSATENIPIEGGNSFTHEYTFRLHDDPNQVSYIFPFVEPETTNILVENFDWDNDGQIRVTSEVRREQPMNVSGDDVWVESKFAIREGEIGKSLAFHLIKSKNPVIKNNNVVITVRNQKGEYAKFYSAPIGGFPRYKYAVDQPKLPPKK